MNRARRKELSRASDLIAQALEIVMVCAEEEREAFDNLAESLQEAERGQAMSEAADALEQAQSSLEEIAELIDSAVES